EMKLQNEGRRIMHHPEFCASVTCVRVPVYRAHSVAVSAEFSEPISAERARETLAEAPGLELVDEPARNRYPMPLQVAGKDNCEVGRVRRDCAFENGLAFWVSGDQLLKGAALNAVQIAELLEMLPSPPGGRRQAACAPQAKKTVPEIRGALDLMLVSYRGDGV